MAEVIIIEVDCDPALYPKVNENLGLDPNAGTGDWPKGLLTHIGGGGDGTVVVEVWRRAPTKSRGWKPPSAPRLVRPAWRNQSAWSG
jgi:hypothetical protein